MRYSFRRNVSRLYKRLFKKRSWTTKDLGLITLALTATIGIYFGVKNIMPAHADTDNEPYSIFILAGQSLAAGVNARRDELTPGDGQLLSQTHPADSATSFWWAGSNGEGLNDAQITAFFPFYNGAGQMGWA